MVMDSDGEDKPDDIGPLIRALYANPGAIVVAERAGRSEGTGFRVGYAAYQTLFRLLIGKRIDFGNFCALSSISLHRLIRSPDTWNHLAAAILRSRIPVTRVAVRRGVRYTGTSSMNIPALVAHGLSAFAVFSDSVFSRLFLFANSLGGIAVLGGIVVLILRFYTDMAIPGWATITFGVFINLFMQSLLLCLLGAVQLLSTRGHVPAQPAAMVPLFVRRIRTIKIQEKADDT